MDQVTVHWLGQVEMIANMLREGLKITSQILPKGEKIHWKETGAPYAPAEVQVKATEPMSLSETLLEKLSLANSLAESLVTDIETIYNKF